MEVPGCVHLKQPLWQTEIDRYFHCDKRAQVVRLRELGPIEAIRDDQGCNQHIIAQICRTDVPDDGVWFDPESVTTARIAEEADYEGVRATFSGRLATTRLSMQIDMGFSDVVTPGPVEISYPTILDYPAPVLRAYNRTSLLGLPSRRSRRRSRCMGHENPDDPQHDMRTLQHPRTRLDFSLPDMRQAYEIKRAASRRNTTQKAR